MLDILENAPYSDEAKRLALVLDLLHQLAGHERGAVENVRIYGKFLQHHEHTAVAKQ